MPRTEAPAAAPAPGGYIPPRPLSLEETGLSRAFLTDCVLRSLYALHSCTGLEVAERLGLHFGAVTAPLLETLRREHAVEVRGQRGVGDAGYIYALTDKGQVRVQEALHRTHYEGPAPVPLQSYREGIAAQAVRHLVVKRDTVRTALSDLVVHETLLDSVGSAVTTGSSLFLFGPPGNGKTSIAERIGRLLGEPVYVPYAVEADGQVIKIFDPINHSLVPEEPALPAGRDLRWVRIQRPVVMAGGELVLSSLDLLYSEARKYYEAPLQLKANLGLLLIDDFGRQTMRPRDLLNRWIVPLEKRSDFLTLATGKTIEVPFATLIVFSTNLDPKDLVDEAFLRRIKFKLYVGDPDEQEYREIFQRSCQRAGVPYEEGALHYLLDQHYRTPGRPLRRCHPRDLVDQLIAIASAEEQDLRLTPELIDQACLTYFAVEG